MYEKEKDDLKEDNRHKSPRWQESRRGDIIRGKRKAEQAVCGGKAEGDGRIMGCRNWHPEERGGERCYRGRRIDGDSRERGT